MKLQALMIPLTLGLLLGCSSNPHKAEKLETAMTGDQTVTGSERVGVKNGNMVVQKKVEMNEELRRLQYEVFELEDKVYGNRKYGSKGLYGALKDCKFETVSKKNGGDGKLMWTEFFANKDWPLASALAIVLLAILVVPFVLMQRLQQDDEGSRT